MKKRSSKNEGPNTRRKLASSESLDSIRSSSAYNYSSRRSTESLNTGRQPEATIKENNSNSNVLKQFILFIPVILILIIFIRTINLSSVPQIIILNHTSSTLTNTETINYQKTAESYLNSSLWNKNKITVDASGLSNALTSKYPEVVGVSLSMPLLSSTPKVYVTQASPVLVVNASNGVFAVDNKGVALYKYDNLSKSSYPASLPLVNVQSSYITKLNSQVLPTTFVSFILSVNAELSAKGYHVSNLNIPVQTDELDASLTGEPYYIKYNLENNDPMQQTGTFLATISQLKSQGITPTKYIDVRIDGRAYYL